jgi:hypothetical protein
MWITALSVGVAIQRHEPETGVARWTRAALSRHGRSTVSTWTIDDALRMQSALARWLRTSDGAKVAHAVNEVIHAAFSSAEEPDWERSGREAIRTADIVATSTLIWCDPHMVDMWAAAADTYPDEELEEHHLPDPEGIIILSKPLPRVIDPNPEYAKEEISAITWSMALNGSGVILMTWYRRRGLDKVGWGRNPRRTILAPGLSPSSLGIREIGRRCEGEETVRLLQALTGLIRSPLVDEAVEAGSKAARKEAARAGIGDPRIRRVYLRKPEHAAAELQAARDARVDQSTKGHWVSGHWKRQWHPSIGEHRWIRIEGYPRGEFIPGGVTLPTVRVARGDRRRR